MKTLKYLSFMLMLMVCSAGFVSCSDDDDDNDGGSVSIVGTWVNTASTESDYEWMTFNSDDTGYFTTKTGIKNFLYVFNPNTNTSNSGELKYWYIDGSYVYTRQVTLTGNTLMLTANGETTIFKRK